MLLPQPYEWPNLSEGTGSVSGQLHGDRKCPFSGITSFGRDWRKVLESNDDELMLNVLRCHLTY